MPATESKITLNDGNSMPVIGLGTGHPEGFESDPVVIDALQVGYRHIDTAFVYNNQEPLGRALLKGMRQLGLSRQDVFVTSKIWNTFHSKEAAVGNCRSCLDLLQVDYLDLLLMHFPAGFKEGGVEMFPKDENGKLAFSDVDYLETWQALEECVKRGWAKSIGVSNFHVPQLQRLLANCTIKPTVNQVEIHPYYAQTELVEFCRKNGIVLTAYAPLGVPKPKVMGNGLVRDMNLHLLDDPVITEIAQRHRKSPAQVVLRWAVQRGTTCVPRSTQKNRLLENISVFDFTISKEDMERINGLNRDQKAYPYVEFQGHKYFNQ